MRDEQYFFPSGIIKYTPFDKEEGENNILATVTYYLRNEIYTDKAILLVLSYIKDGKITTPRSHDNMTAIVVYLVRADAILRQRGLTPPGDLIGAVNSLSIFPDYTHPRDIIFLAYVQGRWWSHLLLPFLLPIFLWMAVTEYKDRPKWKDRFKHKWYGGKLVSTDTNFKKVNNTTTRIIQWWWNYERKDGIKYSLTRHLKADTEILYWIRLKLPPNQFSFMSWVHPYIEPHLIERFGPDWLDYLMGIYYIEGHPNRASTLQS